MKRAEKRFFNSKISFVLIEFFYAGVAQLARASAFQADCREFESRLPLHLIQLRLKARTD